MSELTHAQRQARIELIKGETEALLELQGETDDLVKQQELHIRAMEKHLQLLELTSPLEKDKIKDLRKTIELQKDLADATRENAAAGEKVAEQLGAFFGLNKRYKDSMLGSFEAAITTAEGQQKLGKQIKETFKIQNIAYSFLLKFTQATSMLTWATDDALVAFNKQTGATRLYGDQIMNLEKSMHHHGIGIGQATEAYGSLVNNVYDLKNMSKSTQGELATTTGLLAHMGVSADSTTANIQLMTRSMGVSTAEASQYQRELFTLAKEIGMPPEEMAAGFKAAAPKLMAFGKQAGKVFKTLAVNARAAGMEVEQMLGIVEQFDTFEGAAQSVGKLNALLGGPFLNSMEMVTTTDPTERMRMLSGALNDAGKSFDQMTYYEKKSIAAAAGLSDVNELALVMAGSFDKSAGGAHKSQAEIKKLAEQSAEFNNFQEEMNQLMRMFALQLQPVVKWLKDMAQWVQELNQSMGGYLAPILTGIVISVGLLITGFKILSATMKFFAAVQTVLAPSVAASNVALGASVPAMGAAGTAAGAAGTPMLYFAAAALAVGAAFFLIGAGVAIAALGMAQFIKSLLLIPASELILYGPAFMLFGLGINILTFSLAAMVPLMPLVLFGMVGLIAVLRSLHYWTSGLDWTFLEPLSSMFSAMADAMNAPVENLVKISSTIREISDAIGAIDDVNATVAVTKLMETTSKSSRSGANIVGKNSTQPIKHEITLEFDPRKSNFEDFVINIVNKELNANQG